MQLWDAYHKDNKNIDKQNEVSRHEEDAYHIHIIHSIDHYLIWLLELRLYVSRQELF